MKIKPLFDWILIERVSPVERTAGGIIIPDSAMKYSAEGIVISTGPGKYKKKKGTVKERFHTTTLKAGQRVFFSEYMTKEVEIDGREIIFIREEDVHGIIEEKTEIAVKGHFPVELKKENKVLVRNKSEIVPKKAKDHKGHKGKKKVPGKK